MANTSGAYCNKNLVFAWAVLRMVKGCYCHSRTKNGKVTTAPTMSQAIGSVKLISPIKQELKKNTVLQVEPAATFEQDCKKWVELVLFHTVHLYVNEKQPTSPHCTHHPFHSPLHLPSHLHKSLHQFGFGGIVLGFAFFLAGGCFSVGRCQMNMRESLRLY